MMRYLLYLIIIVIGCSRFFCTRGVGERLHKGEELFKLEIMVSSPPTGAENLLSILGDSHLREKRLPGEVNRGRTSLEEGDSLTLILRELSPEEIFRPNVQVVADEADYHNFKGDEAEVSNEHRIKRDALDL
jgi:hypothetical protein